jgi:hypothetical protein
VGKNRTSNFLDDTISFWSKRYGKQLTDDDAREITTNLTGFIKTLAAWQAKEDADNSVFLVPDDRGNHDK